MTNGAPVKIGLAGIAGYGDLYLEAMKEMNVTSKIAEEQKITLFDGVFDGKDPEKYARSFPVHNIA